MGEKRPEEEAQWISSEGLSSLTFLSEKAKGGMGGAVEHTKSLSPTHWFLWKGHCCWSVCLGGDGML